jgi:hypothetical protein
MAATQSTDYWLERFAAALENAIDAPGERSRTAYVDLARHYWSMHVMIHGGPALPPFPPQSANGGGLLLRWAA